MPEAWGFNKAGQEVANCTITRADMARVANPVPRWTSAAKEGASRSTAEGGTEERKRGRGAEGKKLKQGETS